MNIQHYWCVDCCVDCFVIHIHPSGSICFDIGQCCWRIAQSGMENSASVCLVPQEVCGRGHKCLLRKLLECHCCTVREQWTVLNTLQIITLNIIRYMHFHWVCCLFLKNWKRPHSTALGPCLYYSEYGITKRSSCWFIHIKQLLHITTISHLPLVVLM